MIKPIAFTLLISLTAFSITAQIPAGVIASYQLNTTTSASDISGNNYNGTLTSVSNTTNRLGTANTAISFTAGSSTGALPVGLVTAMQNDFTLGYWFKTSMTAASSPQWYGGNAMVDAEVCGGTNDWGTALIDGGKVCFGVGNTDITIKSVSASYNNNAWHFVTATRNAAGSTIILYIDGAAVASSGAINPGVLNAPALIGLGRNPCNATGVFTGSLDDIVAYSRVLSAAEVSNLYIAMSATALPVTWLSFTGGLNGNLVLLRWEIEQSTSNDHFEIEHATDGIHFLVEGTVRNSAASNTTAGNVSFSFTSATTTAGTHYYRIKQVDKDGVFAYSKTIKLSASTRSNGLWLQTNPVAGVLVLINHNQAMIEQLQVMDMAGRKLISKTVHAASNTIPLGVQQLHSGYYLLRVVTTTGTSSMGLIKQ